MQNENKEKRVLPLLEVADCYCANQFPAFAYTQSRQLTVHTAGKEQSKNENSLTKYIKKRFG